MARLGFVGVLSFVVLGLMMLGLERSEGVTHTVGDATGWGLPSNSDFYDDWADRQVFRVGDKLSFNWTGTGQNVVEVSEQQHDDCIKVTDNVITTSPAVFDLTAVGKRYFITTIGNQCNLGQELEIDILPAAPSTTPPPPRTVVPPPPSTGSPAPAAGTVHFVGDSTGWTVPTTSDFYDDWADRQTFRVGDQIVFNWNGTSQNVVEVTEEQHDDCIKVSSNVITISPAVFNLTAVGKRYFITTIGNQCNIGQELEIDILPASASGPVPPVVTPPTPSTASLPKTHTVGDSTGWTVPTNSDFYDDWAERQIFRVGDKLSFNWTGNQNVVEVTEDQHDDCVKVTNNVITTSPAVFDLTTIGKRYFICTIGNQCNVGQELEILVVAAPPTTVVSPAPRASNPTPSPSSNPTPSGSSPAPSSSTNTTTTSGSRSASSPSGGPTPSSSASFGPMVALSAAFSIIAFSF